MLPACNEVYKRTQEYNKPINTTNFKNYFNISSRYNLTSSE